MERLFAELATFGVNDRRPMRGAGGIAERRADACEVRVGDDASRRPVAPKATAEEETEPDGTPSVPEEKAAHGKARSNGNVVESAGIRDLLDGLLEIGRRALRSSGSKGSGPMMDASQLWETTMDPSKRVR